MMNTGFLTIRMKVRNTQPTLPWKILILMGGGFMDSELILKWMRKTIALLAMIALCICWFCACDTIHGKYPFQVATKWVCDNPYFLLSYPENKKDNEHGELQLGTEIITVDITFGLGDYCVYPVHSVHYDDRLLTGLWDYRNGNLVLSIDEDYLFENQYSELIFAPSSTN